MQVFQKLSEELGQPGGVTGDIGHQVAPQLLPLRQQPYHTGKEDAEDQQVDNEDAAGAIEIIAQLCNRWLEQESQYQGQ